MTGWPPLIDVCFVACLGPNGLTIIEVLMGAPGHSRQSTSRACTSKIDRTESVQPRMRANRGPAAPPSLQELLAFHLDHHPCCLPRRDLHIHLERLSAELPAPCTGFTPIHLALESAVADVQWQFDLSRVHLDRVSNGIRHHVDAQCASDNLWRSSRGVRR